MSLPPSWRCAACTVNNPPKHANCSVCGAARPKKGKIISTLSSTFICSTCTYSNKEGQTQCSMCQAPAPPPPTILNYSAFLIEMDVYQTLLVSAVTFSKELNDTRTQQIAFQSNYQKLISATDWSDVSTARRSAANMIKELRRKAYELYFTNNANDRKAATDELAAARKQCIDSAKLVLSVLSDKESAENDRIAAIAKVSTSITKRMAELSKDLSVVASDKDRNINLSASLSQRSNSSLLNEKDGGGGGGGGGGSGVNEDNGFGNWWIDNQTLIRAANARFRRIVESTTHNGGGDETTTNIALVDLTGDDTVDSKQRKPSSASTAASVATTSSASAASPVSARISNGDVVANADESEVRQIRELLALLNQGVSVLNGMLASAKSLTVKLSSERDKLRTSIAAAMETRRATESIIKSCAVSEEEADEENKELIRLEWEGIRNRIYTERQVLLKMNYEFELLKLSQMMEITPSNDSGVGALASPKLGADEASVAMISAKTAVSKQSGVISTLTKLADALSKTSANIIYDRSISPLTPTTGPAAALVKGSSLLQSGYQPSPAVRRAGVLLSRRPFASEYPIVKNVLSKGNTSKVMLCEQRFDCGAGSKPVVVKQIPLSDGGALFENEIVSRHVIPPHPSISKIETAFIDNEFGYLQTKHYTGGTITQYVTSAASSMRPYDYQALFYQLFAVLQHIHSPACNLTHGNVSTDNIVMSAPPSSSSPAIPILIDFALSRQRLPAINVQLTNSSGITGGNQTAFPFAPAQQQGFFPSSTISLPALTDNKSSSTLHTAPSSGGGSVKRAVSSFAAPEVQKGESPSPASDVWSTGIVIFKLLWKNIEPVVDIQSGMVAIPPPPNSDFERCRDFLATSGILCTDPKKRPAAAEVLNHNYFQTSFAVDLYENRSVMDSKTKCTLFSNALEKLPRKNDDQNPLLLRLRRTAIVKELIPKLENMTRLQLLTKFKVEYTDFKGSQDDGGLTSDLFTEFFIRCVTTGLNESGAVAASSKDSGVASAAAPPAFASSTSTSYASTLFVSASIEDAPKSGATFLPAADNGNIGAHKAFGKMLVKALIDGRPLPIRLAPSLFKFLLNIKPNIKDLEAFDRTAGMSLRKILTIPDVDSVMSLDFGDLKKDGSKIPVTDENKAEYVSLYVQHKLVTSRKTQLQAIKIGFDTIGAELSEHLNRLTCADLMSFCCGDDSMLTAEAIIAHFKWIGFDQFTPTPQHLCNFLSDCFPNDLRRFLRLATAMYALPRSGVLGRPIVIQATSDRSKLPVGHTCHFQIDLPDYQHYETLKEKMMITLAHVNDSGFDYV